MISADSRTTGTVTQQVPQSGNPSPQVTVQTNVVLSDAAYKLFLLFKRFAVGTFGDAIVNNLPIAHHVEQFEARRRANPPQTTNDLASELLNHFHSLQPIPKIGFIVAGYDANTPWVMGVDAHQNSINRINVTQGTTNIDYGIVRGGDTAIVDRLLSQPQFNPPFQVMNLQDAIDYSRHLIRSTIDQMRFEPRFATVGGAIDTAVVTPSSSQFLARKELHCA